MTEQIIYTELEAIALRWPYNQTEPLDAQIVDNTAKSFNASTSLQTLESVGGTGAVQQVYGSNKAGQLIQPSKNSRITIISPYIAKVGAPPDLTLEIYTAKLSGVRKTVKAEYQENTGYFSTSIYGLNWAGQTFTVATNDPIPKISCYIRREYLSNPSDLVVEIRETSNGVPTSNILASTTIPASSVPDNAHAWVDATFSPAFTPTANTMYAIVLHQLNNGGDSNNNYWTARAGSDAYAGGTRIYSTDGGSSWTVVNTDDEGFRVYQDKELLIPDKQIYTENIPASSISSTAGLQNLTLSKDIFLRQNEQVFIVLSAKDGDANNRYDLYLDPAGNDTNPSLNSVYTTDGGSSWTPNTEDHRVDVSGYELVILYQGTYNYPKAPGSATGSAEVSAYANTGSINIYLIIDKSLSTPVSTSNTTPTILTINDDPLVDNYGSLEWIIAANGDGQADYGKFQPRIKYDKNPVYPRDFGFSELYLLQVKAEQAGTLVRLNDKTSIYLANAGDLYQVSEAFRTPVKKLQVVDGQATCDLLGVE